MKLHKQAASANQSIVRLFLMIFTLVTIICSLILIPLVTYSKRIFTELTFEKANQQLNYGITQIENTINGVNSASKVLLEDPRFIPLRYQEPSSASISLSVRKQMASYLHGLFFPLSLVSDSALLISEDEVVSNSAAYFDSIFRYYPDQFCIDDLTFEEWVNELSNHKARFMPIHHLKTNITEYDALIYSIPWTKTSYLYTCINIEDLKSMFMNEQLSDCFLSIATISGEELYTSLPAHSVEEYQTISQNTSIGNLCVKIHIPVTTFTDMMKPLYLFLWIYGLATTAIFIITILLGSRLSSRPLLALVNNLEQNIEQKQNTISMQKQILKARFLEKAVNGQINTLHDQEQFDTYLPNFPEEYCMVSLQLTEVESDHGTIYENPFHLLQMLVTQALPNAYQQQITDTELLLIIALEDMDDYVQSLNFLIDNINREEPSYQVRCVASRIHENLESLPVAYREIQVLYGLHFPNSRSQVCTFSDDASDNNTVNIAEIFTLYTAVSYGNLELALQKFHPYTLTSSKESRHVYELIHAIISNIKMERYQQLKQIIIPFYQPGKNNWAALEETIISMCNLIKAELQPDQDSFVKQLQTYIDEHYTEYELCVASLEEQFQCSSSKIRKAFKAHMGITVNDYIEKKRMELANELLFQKEKNINEIALECGFANGNSFYKAYRRIYGHSPSTGKTD